jgi:hypothetical protein
MAGKFYSMTTWQSIQQQKLKNIWTKQFKNTSIAIPLSKAKPHREYLGSYKR